MVGREFGVASCVRGILSMSKSKMTVERALELALKFKGSRSEFRDQYHQAYKTIFKDPNAHSAFRVLLPTNYGTRNPEEYIKLAKSWKGTRTEFGTKYNVAWDYLRSVGLLDVILPKQKPSGYRPPKLVTKQQERQILEAHVQGVPVSKIIRDVGHNRNSVVRVLRKNGRSIENQKKRLFIEIDTTLLTLD